MKLTNVSAALLALLTCTTKLTPTYAATVQQETRSTKTEIQTRSTHTTNSATSAQVVMMKQKTETTQKIQQIIPTSAAIAIGFPNDMILNAKDETVTTLRTAQPVYDQNGSEVAPENSLITARLKPVKGGVEIVADSILIRGRVIPLRASSVVVIGQSVSVVTGLDGSKEGHNVGARAGAELLGLINPNNGDGMRAGGLGGGLLGMILGAGKAKKETIVKIPGGSIYVLSVESSVVLP
jgi:hypothetical protein